MESGYVKVNASIDMVDHMPIDDTSKRDLRIRIRRWVRQLKDQGVELEE